MRQLLNPEKAIWADLCQRPQLERKQLEAQVRAIMAQVQQRGDEALFEFNTQFDGVALSNLKVSTQEFENAEANLETDLKSALDLALQTIRTFHESQRLAPKIVETAPGVKCWQKQVAIDRVGLYVPGGTAPLFSTLMMLGVPAQLAGCKEIRVCTPPAADGTVHPAILYLAKALDITEVFKTGGSQAIAAFCYGTESIGAVDKIFGPGNQYVTKAKELAQLQGLAIDMPAGPSELLVIADEAANPEYVAADLLSQAEHGVDSQVILVTNSQAQSEAVQLEIERQKTSLPRKAMVEKALANSQTLVFNDLETGLDFSNTYAPEHLIINCKNATSLAEKVRNAGSVFIGPYSSESAGDYASGTNHTLPTSGFARNYSGVNLQSFCKLITFQELSAQGLKSIGQAVENLAAAEGLQAHKNAMTVRLKDIDDV